MSATTASPGSSIMVGSFVGVTALATFGVFATFARVDARPSYWVMAGSVALAVALVGSLFWAPSMLRRMNPSIPTPFVIAWGSAVGIFAFLLVGTSFVFGMVFNTPEWDAVYAWTVVFEVLALAGTLIAVTLGGRIAT